MTYFVADAEFIFVDEESSCATAPVFDIELLTSTTLLSLIKFPESLSALLKSVSSTTILVPSDIIPEFILSSILSTSIADTDPIVIQRINNIDNINIFFLIEIVSPHFKN